MVKEQNSNTEARDSRPHRLAPPGSSQKTGNKVTYTLTVGQTPKENTGNWGNQKYGANPISKCARNRKEDTPSSTGSQDVRWRQVDDSEEVADLWRLRDWNAGVLVVAPPQF